MLQAIPLAAGEPRQAVAIAAGAVICVVADGSPLATAVVDRLRELNQIPDATYATFRKGIEHPDPAISANVIIGLIRVASYLLDRQLRHLEETFVKEGGLRERMTRARLEERKKARP